MKNGEATKFCPLYPMKYISGNPPDFLENPRNKIADRRYGQFDNESVGDTLIPSIEAAFAHIKATQTQGSARGRCILLRPSASMLIILQCSRLDVNHGSVTIDKYYLLDC